MSDGAVSQKPQTNPSIIYHVDHISLSIKLYWNLYQKSHLDNRNSNGGQSFHPESDGNIRQAIFQSDINKRDSNNHYIDWIPQKNDDI